MAAPSVFPERLPEGCAFHWTGGAALLGRVLHTDLAPGVGALARDDDPLPGWTFPSITVLPIGPADVLAGRFSAWLSGDAGPDGRAWRGTPVLAARLLAVLDALVGSATHPMAPADARERALLGFSPAPGGALDLLISLSWAVGLAFSARVAGVCPALGLAAPVSARAESLALARSSLAGWAPVPPWALGSWGGDPLAPPVRGGTVEFAEPHARPARLAERALARASAARFALSGRAVRARRAPGGRSPSPALRRALDAEALGVYADATGSALRAASTGLRAVAAVRFALDRLAAEGDVPGVGPLETALAPVRTLGGGDPLALWGLPRELRDALGIDPAWLVAGEAALARLWDAHARSCVRTVWGVGSERPDGPDAAGAAVPLTRPV